MFDFATTTMSSAMHYVLPLMFALQPGASSVAVLREAAEQPQLDRRAVPLFEPTDSSFDNFQIAVQKQSTISQSSAWVEAELEKIESYAGLSDGWRGEGSFAPTEQTLQEAAEGFACLHWNSSSLLATISVYGDGTYSFFSEGYGVVARSGSDNELVGAILPQRLIESMTGQYALEATLAA